jgi:excisionase family DNA binding protein
MQEEVTTAQLAERFHVTLRTIQRWIKSGRLKVRTLARDHYLIDTDLLTTETTFKSEETRLEHIEQQLEDINMRVKRLERRKIIIRKRIQ